MKKTLLTAIVLLTYSLIFAQLKPTAPIVVSTVPEFGDCQVDTGTMDVIFKFDQDMSPGMTIYKTQNFPELTGKPQWIDSRTLTIPCRLYSNQRYSIVLNNRYPMNFASTSGITLNPQELMFQTKTGILELSNQKNDNQIKSYLEFQKFFPKEYSYASIKGIDWLEVIRKNSKEFENSMSNPEFALKLIKILRLAEDPHLSIVLGGQQLSTKYRNAVDLNFNLKAVRLLLGDLQVSKTTSSFAGTLDSVGYISIDSWTTDPNTLKFKREGDTSNYESSFDEVLTRLSQFPNLIVDVRSNSGGNELFARDFASLFVDEAKPYENVKCFNPKTGRFDLTYTHSVESSSKRLKYSGNIFVLSGPYVFSSNESFILMMKQVPNAKVIGMKTYGGSGNPVPHTLPNGIIVNLPSWQAFTLDGKRIEGNGIEPDIEVKTIRSDFTTKDILLEKVLSMIKNKADCKNRLHVGV